MNTFTTQCIAKVVNFDSISRGVNLPIIQKTLWPVARRAHTRETEERENLCLCVHYVCMYDTVCVTVCVFLCVPVCFVVNLLNGFVVLGVCGLFTLTKNKLRINYEQK